MRSSAEFVTIACDGVDRHDFVIFIAKESNCTASESLLERHIFFGDGDVFDNSAVNDDFDRVKLFAGDFAVETEVKTQAFGSDVTSLLSDCVTEYAAQCVV